MFICIYVLVILYINMRLKKQTNKLNYECLIERKPFGNYHIIYALYELHLTPYTSSGFPENSKPHMPVTISSSVATYADL